MFVSSYKMKTIKICPVCNDLFEATGRQRVCSGKCRQKLFYHNFKRRTGIRYKKRVTSRYKASARNKLTSGGVCETGGCFVAHISVLGKGKSKSFSITKLGSAGAKLAASLQRMVWLIETGVWNPKDGDPFQILSYSESFKGNNEYENSVVDDVSSPWIPEREQ